VDIPICAAENVEGCEATRYINDYVAKGILISPIIYILRHAAQLVVVWGVLLSKT
jgi:hypothetical protein